ncbi:HNH endonuclease [Streptomyces sp. NPDC004592]
MNEPQRCTREMLAKAAEHCSDIDEVIAYLGMHPSGQLRRQLFRSFERFRVDITHFRRFKRGRRPCPQPSRTELAAAVAQSLSVAGTLRRLHLPGGSRVHTRFHEWITEYGIDTSHFLGQAHQRGKPGTIPRKPATEVLVKHDGRRRTKSALLRRALTETGVPERCDECGTPPEWHGRPMRLEIDHVNGDWSDDRRENLRLLCPNCHATTNTWCRGGRRRGS